CERRSLLPQETVAVVVELRRAGARLCARVVKERRLFEQQAIAVIVGVRDPLGEIPPRTAVASVLVLHQAIARQIETCTHACSAGTVDPVLSATEVSLVSRLSSS